MEMLSVNSATARYSPHPSRRFLEGSCVLCEKLKTNITENNCLSTTQQPYLPFTVSNILKFKVQHIGKAAVLKKYYYTFC